MTAGDPGMAAFPFLRDRAASAVGRLLSARHSSLAAMFAILILHGGYTIASGIMVAADTKAYVYWAGRLIDSGFDYPTLLAEAETGFPPILYALFATLIALLRLAFGEYSGLALVTVNLAAHVTLGILLARLASRVTGSGLGGWTALVLFLACQEIVRWVPFLLSDSTFVLLAFYVFTLAAARILGESSGWLPVALPAAAAIFYRPTGIVLVPDLAWAAYLSRRREKLRRKWLLPLVALPSLLAAAFAFAWIVQDPGRWPFRPLTAAWTMIAEGYRVGEVVSARPETAHAPPQLLLDYVLISADRFAHFFAIGAADYSLVHWLVSLAFFVPCYALAAWLCVALVRGRSGFAPPQARVFLAAAGAVLAYALFHAFVQIDFDWRYRLPVLPHLILLASGGAVCLLRSLDGHWQRK